MRLLYTNTANGDSVAVTLIFEIDCKPDPLSAMASAEVKRHCRPTTRASRSLRGGSFSRRFVV